MMERQKNYTFLALVLLFCAILIIVKSLCDYKKEFSLPPHTTPIAIPTPDPKRDPLTYIRWKGQQEGFDDYTISSFIRIARVESHDDLNSYAKNPTSTAKGVFQFIDSTWRAYCNGNVYDFVDNIDCFYKVLETDGYPEGLSHWQEALNILEDGK